MTATPRACPVCAGTGRQVLHRNRLAPLDDLDLSYDVVRCEACGMVFGDAIPGPAVYDRYYVGYSKYDGVEELARIPALVRTAAEAAAAFLAPHVRPDVGVLDVGSAIGVFLDALKRRGFADVRGLDPAPRAGEVARALFGIEVRQGMLDDAFDAKGAGLVTLLQVLEHLPDPARALGAIARTLPPGGLLYLEVPAADRFHTLDGEWLGELSHEHINFFGRGSLANLAARLGFEEVAAEHATYLNGQAGLRGLYRRRADGPAAIVPDAASGESVAAYLAAAEVHRARFEAILAPFHGRPLGVYGAGAHTARLLAQTSLARCAIPFVVDGNPNLVGKRMGGLPIVGRDALRADPALPVLISSYLARGPILADLRATAPNPVHLLYDPPA